MALLNAVSAVNLTEEEVGRYNDRTLVSARYLTISCTDQGAEGLVGCAAPRRVQRRLKRAEWLRIDLKRALGAFGWSVEKTTEVYPRPNAGFPASSTPQVARSTLFWPNWRGAEVPAPLPSAVALDGTTSAIAVSTIGDGLPASSTTHVESSTTSRESLSNRSNRRGARCCGATGGAREGPAVAGLSAAAASRAVGLHWESMAVGDRWTDDRFETRLPSNAPAPPTARSSCLAKTRPTVKTRGRYLAPFSQSSRLELGCRCDPTFQVGR